MGQLSFLEGLRRLKKHNLSNVWLKCLKFQQKIVIYETVSLVSINQWSGVQAQSKLQLGLQNQEKQLSSLFFSARSQIEALHIPGKHWHHELQLQPQVCGQGLARQLGVAANLLQCSE